MHRRHELLRLRLLRRVCSSLHSLHFCNILSRYCWTVRRVFALWFYSESWLTKIWTLALSLGVTCACVYTSMQSPQWTTPPSPSSAEPSALKTEDVSVLFALAFDVSAVACFAAAAALQPFAKL
jgi:hypothetical protein